MSKILFVGPSAEIEFEDEPKPCASCPKNPVEAMIRNGGEDGEHRREHPLSCLRSCGL